MQPPDRPHRFGAAEVHLDDAPIAPGAHERQLLSAERIEEGATMVGKGLCQQLEDAVDRGAAEFSGQRLTL